MEQQLSRLVEHYLTLHLYDNATFLAERLFAQAGTESNRYLLASCYIYAGRRREALTVLAASRAPANRYLFALYAIEAGQYQEAEDALLRSSGLRYRSGAEMRALLVAEPSRIPNGAAGAYLLGVAAQRTDRATRAVEWYTLALLLDPFMWCAYDALARLGHAPPPARAFDPSRVREPLRHPANAALAARAAGAGGGSPFRGARQAGVLMPSPVANVLVDGTGGGSKAATTTTTTTTTTTPSGAPAQAVLVPSPMMSPLTPATMMAVSGLVGPGSAGRAGAGAGAGGGGGGGGPTTPAPARAAAAPGKRQRQRHVALMPASTGEGHGMVTPSADESGPVRAIPLAFGSAGGASVPAPPSATAAASMGGSLGDVSGLHSHLQAPPSAIPHSQSLALDEAASFGFSPVPLHMTHMSDRDAMTDASRLASRLRHASLHTPSGPDTSAFVTPSAGMLKQSRAVSGRGTGAGAHAGWFPSASSSITEGSEEEGEEGDEDAAAVAAAVAAAAADMTPSPAADAGSSPAVPIMSAVRTLPMPYGTDYAPGPASMIMSHGKLSRRRLVTTVTTTTPAARPAAAPDASAWTEEEKYEEHEHGDMMGAGVGFGGDISALSAFNGGSPVDVTVAGHGHGGGHGQGHGRGHAAAAAAHPPSTHMRTAVRGADGSTIRGGIASGYLTKRALPMRLQFMTPAEGGGGGAAALTTPAGNAGGSHTDGSAMQPSVLGSAIAAMQLETPTGPAAVTAAVTVTVADGAGAAVVRQPAAAPAAPAPRKGGQASAAMHATSPVAPPSVPPFAANMSGSSTSTSTDSPGRRAKRPLSATDNSDTEEAAAAAAQQVKAVGPVAVDPAARRARAAHLHQQLQDGVTAVLALLSGCGAVVHAMAAMDCAAVVRAVAALPGAQRATGWAQHMLARGYYEQGQYERARKAFEEMRRLSPERMDGCDLYSTVLWHMRATTDLVHLAQELVAADKMRPQAWCVMGNAASCSRDHAGALAHLRRAVALDPRFVTAHTLMGHEYSAVGELDKAADCFRNALQLEPRHYSAWYGLGTVYFKQEKHDAAEAHYRKALELHPSSSVLHAYMGCVLARNSKFSEALQHLKTATALDPHNAQAAYQRAQVYMAIGKHDLARRELLAVHESNPREPAVLIQLGKLCKRVGALEDAARAWTLALELLSAAGDKRANGVRAMLHNLGTSNNGIGELEDDDVLV